MALVVVTGIPLSWSHHAVAEPVDGFAAWTARMADTKLIAPACIEVTARFLGVRSGNPSPEAGVPLRREPIPDERVAELERAEKRRGLPFQARDGRVRRMPTLKAPDVDRWLVAAGGDGLANRAVSPLELAPGRKLWLFDHMSSPITSSSSVWESTAQGFKLLAHFTGEVTHLEDRAEQVVLHLSDTVTAVDVRWDKARGAFIGACMVDLDAAASAPEGFETAIRAAIPKAAKTGAKERPMYLIGPASADGTHYRIGAIAARTEYIELLVTDGGWTLALAPARATTPEGSLFRHARGRVWRMGWLAP
jgi:hypothetical protein